MKLRFGIREKFALLAFALVLAVAWILPWVLFRHTHSVVQDHELVDLQDEAELRCWEITDGVKQARQLTKACAEDAGRLAVLKTYLSEAAKRAPSSSTGEQAWWRYILAVEARAPQGVPTVLHRAPHLGDIAPPPSLIAAARHTPGPHISTITSLVVPGGFDGTTQAAAAGAAATQPQRIPVIWVACGMPSVPDTVVTLLVSLERGRSSRHLSFLMDEHGGFLLHPYVRPDGQVEPVYAASDLFKECEAITAKKAWGRGADEEQAQTQRSDAPRSWPLAQPFFFLEGELAPAMHAALVKDNDDHREAVLQWTDDLRRTLATKGVPFSGAVASSNVIRLLARTEAGIAEARAVIDAAYRSRYAAPGGKVDWKSLVPLENGAVQFTRFYLREPQHADATPAGSDPPYHFAYAAFREELASSISHEMEGLRRAALLLAMLSSVVAFVIAFLFIRPLTRIAETAQSVTRHGSDVAQLQLQIEKLRAALPVLRGDESGDVARALESLLRQILNSHEQLRQLNADLDSRVREKTTELREANEQLRGLAAAKDAFLASVSHELRQPLNSIFGFMQFLELSNLDDEQKHDMAKLRAAASYLRRLIDDILDYQKIIMGGVELDPEDFEAGPFMTSLRDGMAPQAQEKTNRLEFTGIEKLGTVFNDKGRLQQVLVNLISNACKFTQNGTVKVEASRETDATGKDWVTFDVSDSGRGMKPEEMQGLFVRFKKLSAREGNKTGTGLGLVISKGLCELMGGSITCRSEFGKGSTFSVRIPAEVPEKPGGSTRWPSHTTVPATPARIAAAGSLVLVIDDDPAVRELMTRFLQGEGFRVITAENGEQGRALAKEHHPAVITLDVVLPGAENGWDVLAHLKDDEETSGIPVIIVTFLEEPRHGFALGAADYIVKPIAWDQLAGSIQKVTHSAATTAPVLVVDDDADVRELFRRTLARDNMTVIESANGMEALQRLREQKPSAILLDLMMPVMDGFEFLAEFNCHPEWRDIPVVVITAKHLTREDRQNLDSSVRTILEKSGFTQEDLLNKVLQLVHHHAGDTGTKT